jgi:sulfate permease, SulP family
VPASLVPHSRSLRVPGPIRPGAGDVVAGISVALVLIPQSLAYAQLAGMPAVRGLYASAVPPLASARFTSSPFLQPGPTAVSALLTFGALAPLAAVGSPRYVALGMLLALVVGVVRVLVGMVRFGWVAYLLSEPMLLGFVPAAGILIISSQIPLALGMTASDRGVLVEAASSILHPGAWQVYAVVLSVTVACLLVVLPRIHPLLPSVLLVAVLGIAVGGATDYSAATVGSIDAGFPPVSFHLPWSELTSLLLPGMVIALLGFTEAASIARTYAAIDRRRWDPDREFVGQGVANVASAFTGGFPVGASFSRSALNRMAGARTAFSAVVTGLAVLAFLPFASVLSSLPLAVLATIVIVAVVNLVRLRPVLRLARLSKPQFVVAACTFTLTLALEPHIEVAVLVGISLSIAVHLWRELSLEIPSWTDRETLHLRPRGVLWFGSAARLEDTFLALIASHPDASRLEIHLDGLGRIDMTGALALRRLIQEGRESGLTVEVVDVRPRWSGLVENVIGRRDDPLNGRT